MTLVGTEGPDLVVSRALSRLAHLLDRAGDRRVPLAEQVRRLAQFTASLDTFFLTGGSVTTGASGNHDPSTGDATATAGSRMHNALHDLSAEADRLLHDVLLPAAVAEGMMFPGWHDVTRQDQARLRTWFLDNVYPIITPMSVDATHPFPKIAALTLNLGVLVRDRRTSERFACVQVPAALPHHVRLDGHRAVLTHAVIGGTLEDVFAGMEIVEHTTFRVSRRVGSTPLRAPGTPYRQPSAIERGAAVRLEVQHTASERLVDELVAGLGLDARSVYRYSAPLGVAASLAAVTNRSRQPGAVVNPVSIPAPLGEVVGSL